MEKIDLMASEMSFENVNGRQAGCVYILYNTKRHCLKRHSDMQHIGQYLYAKFVF